MSELKYSAVVSTDLENGMGKSGEGLLWHVPAELRHFKSLTKNHPIVMGRKTFESIGRPLPDRQNIVLTRDLGYKAEGCTIIHNPFQLELMNLIDNEVMIIGGLEIYKLFWDKLSTIYQSVLQWSELRCDLFFPKVTIKEWDLDTVQTNVNFNLMIYRRK